MYKGNVLITVTKPRSNFPDITFYQLGMKNSNTIRGYIAIITSIATTVDPQRTWGAHAFLEVIRTRPPITSPSDNNK
jgi:hypothetical protein